MVMRKGRKPAEDPRLGSKFSFHPECPAIISELINGLQWPSQSPDLRIGECFKVSSWAPLPQDSRLNHQPEERG